MLRRANARFPSLEQDGLDVARSSASRIAQTLARVAR